MHMYALCTFCIHVCIPCMMVFGQIYENEIFNIKNHIKSYFSGTIYKISFYD